MVQGPAQAQTPEARSAAFDALLDLLSCSLPSHKPLIAYAANAGHPIESWLTHVDLKGVNVDDTLPPSDRSPSESCIERDGRAYHLLTYLIQALDHICYLVRHVGISRQKCLRIKQIILASHYPAMATRTQRFWQSPYANLAGYQTLDGTSMLDLGVLPASSYYEAWYAERKERGEIGQMVDQVGELIEGIERLCNGVARGPKL